MDNIYIQLMGGKLGDDERQNEIVGCVQWAKISRENSKHQMFLADSKKHTYRQAYIYK